MKPAYSLPPSTLLGWIAPPSASALSTSSSNTPLMSWILPSWLYEVMNGPTSPAVAFPPRNPNRSTSTVLAPLRALATAAAIPAGPPPTTSTSASAATGTSFAYGMRSTSVTYFSPSPGPSLAPAFVQRAPVAPTRASRHHLRRQHLRRFNRPTLDQIDDHPAGRQPHLEARRADAGQRRVDQRRPLQVVVGDDRELLRHLNAALPEAAHQRHGQRITRGHGGRHVMLDQLPDGVSDAFGLG